ncbi:hypothetical protein EJ06DRAFT_559831 [Trichodelitschia bisporula]|uniref:C2H2 type master regulator of conidiophore development brlA n=1 Tax=Trichodelitschia bisporula TaxID=703511 RepID=A0A6G1HLD8_9PEZI|nr:hypothetical protein EJ06DRAFT_559831 [Trichodelitschia bisporula]
MQPTIHTPPFDTSSDCFTTSNTDALGIYAYTFTAAQPTPPLYPISPPGSGGGSGDAGNQWRPLPSQHEHQHQHQHQDPQHNHAHNIDPSSIPWFDVPLTSPQHLWDTSVTSYPSQHLPSSTTTCAALGAALAFTDMLPQRGQPSNRSSVSSGYAPELYASDSTASLASPPEWPGPETLYPAGPYVRYDGEQWPGSSASSPSLARCPASVDERETRSASLPSSPMEGVRGEGEDAILASVARVRKRRRRTTVSEFATHRCALCGHHFDRTYNYNQHMHVHNPNRERPFVCPYAGCGHPFVRLTDLRRHESSKHLKKRPHACGYCKSTFARKDTLRRHVEDGCTKRRSQKARSVSHSGPKANPTLRAKPLPTDMQPQQQTGPNPHANHQLLLPQAGISILGSHYLTSAGPVKREGSISPGGGAVWVS